MFLKILQVKKRIKKIKIYKWIINWNTKIAKWNWNSKLKVTIIRKRKIVL